MEVGGRVERGAWLLGGVEGEHLRRVVKAFSGS